MELSSTPYNNLEFRSVNCNFCTEVCSNYMAYKGHVWSEHADELLNGQKNMKPAPWVVSPVVQDVYGFNPGDYGE